MPGISSTFKSGEPSLSDVLRDINEGKIQLPDFQRGWVWDDSHIRSLIASVSLSYPIGAVMLLQTGGDGVQFQPRLVQGVEGNGNQKPEFLILDGQQRMTSLYLALYSKKPVHTQTEKGQDIKRWYYLDIQRCLDPAEERMDAILSIPQNRKVTSDFGRMTEIDVTSMEKEHELGLFPVELLFDHERYSTWRQEYEMRFWPDRTRIGLFHKFENEIINRFKDYRIPTIELLNNTPKEAVCQIFEKVNTGGVTLSVFELVTAIFAADNFNLRQNWEERDKKLKEVEVLADFDATTFLTAVTLLSSYRNSSHPNGNAVTCKRRDVLKLTLAEYKEYADQIEASLFRVAKFLARECVFDYRSLPYSTQLIPLAVTCAVLGERFNQDPIHKKLAQWYWCGVLGELYGGANETRFAFDVPEVVSWIDGGDLPRTIKDANFAPTRLLSMQSRLSAAYKGLMALLMKHGCVDFYSGDTIELTSYSDLAIDIHHIFPKAYCEKQKYKRSLWNSSVNKAPLSAKTNRLLGGHAPSAYLTAVEKTCQMTPERLEQTVRTHLIDPPLLRNNSFEDFIIDRAGRLLDLIERAMGKAVTGRDSEEVIRDFGAALNGETAKTELPVNV